MRPEEKKLGNEEWFASLHTSEIDTIREWWENTCKPQRYCLPYVIEYKRKKYEVDGNLMVDVSYGGRMELDGTISCGKKKASFTLEYDHGFNHGEGISIGSLDDDNVLGLHEDEGFHEEFKDYFYDLVVDVHPMPSYH